MYNKNILLNSNKKILSNPLHKDKQSPLSNSSLNINQDIIENLIINDSISIGNIIK